MTTIADNPPARRWRSVASWTIRIVLALAFLGSGLFKLSGRPEVIDEFARVGLGQWLRYVTAALEIGGAALLVWPRTVALGALILTGICVGAFFAQLFRLHIDIVHTIVLATICASMAWAYRDQLVARS